MKEILPPKIRTATLIVILAGTLILIVATLRETQDVRQRAQEITAEPTYGALGPCIGCDNSEDPLQVQESAQSQQQVIQNLNTTPCPVGNLSIEDHAASDNRPALPQTPGTQRAMQVQQSKQQTPVEQPSYNTQPGYVQPTASQYRQPAYTQPTSQYTQPGYAQPTYAQNTRPGYAQPTTQYQRPGYAQPTYSQQYQRPGYAQPTYAQNQQPGYGQPNRPGYAQPTYSQNPYQQPQQPVYYPVQERPAQVTRPGQKVVYVDAPNQKPKKVKPSKHKPPQGGVSSSMDRFMRLLLDLLMLILQLLGGGQLMPGGITNPPAPSGTPSTPGAPCGPSAAPSVKPSSAPGASVAPGISPGVSGAISPKPSAVPSIGKGRTIKVTNTEQLKKALTEVKPNETIEMADGNYDGPFTAEVAGVEGQPIILRGTQKATLSGGAFTNGTVLTLKKANFWQLDGFTITNGQKGIVIDNTNGAKVSNIQINSIGERAIQVMNNSTNNTLQNNNIKRTGLQTPASGEGIVIGSGDADKSDKNIVINNIIAETTAESIEIMGGSTGGQVKNNNMNGSSMNGADGADSWMIVDGTSYIIESNFGTKAFLDGIQVRGNSNVFINNNGSVGKDGIGIKIEQGTTGNVVKCNNIFNGGKGNTNVTCAP